MSLESIYYIGQTVAVIAILGSLIALIAQTRLANELARDAAEREQIEGLKNLSRMAFEVPGLADVFNRRNADLSQLSDEDRTRYITFLTYCFRTFEGLHTNFLHGRVSTDLWQAHARQLRDVQDLSGPQQVWKLRRHLFSEAFITLFESNMNDGASREIYGQEVEAQEAIPETEKVSET